MGVNYLPSFNQSDIKGHKVKYELSDKGLMSEWYDVIRKVHCVIAQCGLHNRISNTETTIIKEPLNVSGWAPHTSDQGLSDCICDAKLWSAWKLPHSKLNLDLSSENIYPTPFQIETSWKKSKETILLGVWRPLTLCTGTTGRFLSHFQVLEYF